MNRKGEGADLMMNVVLPLIIVIIFSSGLIYFVNSQREGAEIWSEFYVKEIVKIIDKSDEVQIVSLDVQKATEIAKKKGIVNPQKIFDFDNSNKKVCVGLDPYRRSCLNYFNDVDITEFEVIVGKPINILKFEISNRDVTDG